MYRTQILTVILLLLAGSIAGVSQSGDQPIKTGSFRIGAETDHVNVMGNTMPSMPQFPGVTRKPGVIRGYVKDLLGQPITGAKLGLKSARLYDAYLGASAETDRSGYYEIKIPTGGARFDYAGFSIKYSRGMAALGLHPADGNLSESYPASSGGVENFVMLPYGIGDVEGASKDPRYRGNYYGGTMLIRYFIAPPGQDGGGFGSMLAAGSEIVIELNPVSIISDGGSFARGFQIVKRVEDSSLGEFYICNVPVGRYDIVIRQANGKPLRMKQKNPSGTVYGIQPMETSGVASLIFNPLSADAKTATASRGNWTDLEIIVERL